MHPRPELPFIIVGERDHLGNQTLYCVVIKLLAAPKEDRAVGVYLMHGPADRSGKRLRGAGLQVKPGFHQLFDRRINSFKLPETPVRRCRIGRERARYPATRETSDHHPAINAKHLPGDVGGFVGREERHSIGDLLRRAPAFLQRDQPPHALQRLLAVEAF